jgi:selenium-binding protein 1
VISLADLTASVWLWHMDRKNGNGDWKIVKVLDIPTEPASEESLPPMLKAFKVVPPLASDIVLSLDDRFLYVSCWGTSELRQYDVSDPFHPKLSGSVRIGGIVKRTPHQQTCRR